MTAEPIVQSRRSAMKGRRPVDPVMRFWKYVDAEGDCWVWIGAISNETGYGNFRQGKSEDYAQIGAHRFAWQLLVGPIPEGLQIDHLCRNRACVNPDHLEVVTVKVNRERAIGSRDHHIRIGSTCPRGHDRNPGNVYYRDNGYPECRVCRRVLQKAARQRRREVA
jgi:HNH endonuclease